MLQKYFENVLYKPKIFLFADPDSLGLSLIDHLLVNFCEVIVVTSKVETWKEKTGILKENKLFKIISTEEEVVEYDLSYSIFIDVYINRSQKEIDKAIKINQQILGKKFVLFPFLTSSLEENEKYIKTKENFVEKNFEVEYFYIGDILGPNINSQSFIYELFLLLKKSQSINSRSYIYPLLAREVSKQLVKNLFSFGPLEKEVAFLGPKIPIQSFVEYVLRMFPEYKVFSYNKMSDRQKTGEYSETYFDTNLNYSVKETLSWLEDNVDEKDVTFEKTVFRKEKTEFVLPKIYFKFDSAKIIKGVLGRMMKSKKIKLKQNIVLYPIFGLLLFFSVPFLLLIISSSSFLGSLNMLQKGKSNYSVILANISMSSSIFTHSYFNLISQVPFAGVPYKNLKFTTGLIVKGNQILDRSLDLYEASHDLPSKIFGNEIYPISDMSKEIALELDSLHREISFLVGDIEALEENDKRFVERYIPSQKISDLKRNLFFAKNTADNLDQILGLKNAQTYLILFQNNMELRPTGGFLGSFALVRFENGRLTDINIQDVYSADGQLKGHVEPPAPIKDHLGEAGWFMRDANWSPDFIDSAQKIEWFLDKEIGQEVDGVIAIDLEVVKDILRLTGPIYLNDFNKTIDYKNMYEITQTEVEENFFPGSRKKSNFLTALSREIMIKLTSSKEINNFSLARVLYNGLEGRHVQLYFHDTSFQKIISEAGYSGEVITKGCKNNCFYNFASYIDANVGVNKANYFIEKDINLTVFFDEKEVKNILSINIKNNANPLLGDKVRYKSYSRALGLPGSNFNNVKIIEYGQESEVVPDVASYSDFKEAGSVFLVGPGEQKTIEFSWTNELLSELNLSVPGELGIFFRKQAGTFNDKFSVNLFVPSYLQVDPNSNFTLTGQGSYVYNTLLTRDVFPLIYWK